MVSNLKIRQMIPSDLQHVGPLYRQMIEERKGVLYPRIDDIEKEIEDFTFTAMRTLRAMAEERMPKTWLAIVAVDGGVSKGFLSGGLCSRLMGQPKYYFLGEVIYVTAKFRHRGIAEDLVRFATEWAVANGAGALEVAFQPGSEAHKQWARMGFRSYTGVAVFADGNFRPILDYPRFQADKRDGDIDAGSRKTSSETDRSGDNEHTPKAEIAVSKEV